MPDLTSDEYERLTEHVVRSITTGGPLTTLRLARDVVVSGKGSSNQIDVTVLTHSWPLRCRLESTAGITGPPASSPHPTTYKNVSLPLKFEEPA